MHFKSISTANDITLHNMYLYTVVMEVTLCDNGEVMADEADGDR